MVSQQGRMQKTIRSRIDFAGIGVHSGKPIQMSLLPADAGTGIVFVRAGEAAADAEIPALVGKVTATELCTVLGGAEGMCVATVEHLLAALTALGVDNATVELDGPEVPVMDGSAGAFVAEIDRVGLRPLNAARRFIRVLKPVRVEIGAGYAELRPFGGRRFEVGIEYESPLIGRQDLTLDLTPARFRTEIARARTFGFMADVQRLWAAGYALGSSLENSVAIGDDRIVNPEGLRWPDEFVRHKMLDAIGDLALAGAPILGHFRSFRGGHRLNAAVVAALLDDRDAWTMVGAGERETRTENWPETMPGLPAPAFAPEIA